MMIRLAMVGFGNVGQEFARLLISRRDWLRKKRGLEIEVVAIATRTRGSVASREPLSLERALRAMKEGTLRGYGPEWTSMPPRELIESCGADLLVELTTLNVASGQPAIDHIRTALGRRMHVVTANKGPIAFAYADLKQMASSMGVQLRFEGTVMDGTPVFSLVERTLPGCEVIGVAGILNCTTNYLLTEMARGRSMEEALGEAQRMGIAEADPSMDVDGWDAAAKITALANVLMDARSNPMRVDRRGIRDIDPERVMSATSRGTKIKLLARAERAGNEVRTSVGPEAVGADSPFWPVDGTSSAVTIRTDLMGDITIIESNPTLRQTAYAVFSDILLIAESLKGARP